MIAGCDELLEVRIPTREASIR